MKIPQFFKRGLASAGSLSLSSRSVEAVGAGYRQALAASKREIEGERQSLTGETSADDLSDSIAQSQNLLVFIETYLAQFLSRMEKFAAHRMARAEYLRFLQWLHDVMRPVRLPDPLNTILIAIIFTLGEGGMTAAMMIAEGKMDIVTGIAYGLIFAAINVIVGIVAGFFGLRFALYKLKSPSPEPEDGAIRVIAQSGFGIAIFILVLLIFSAARVRALGGHEHIFDFGVVGFFATFNDGLAIIIIVIGVISSILAIWKGTVGLSDCCPGLSEARRHAEERVDYEVEAATEEALEIVDTRTEDFLEQAHAALQSFEAKTKERKNAKARLNAKIRAHEDAVDQAISAIILLSEERQMMRARVKKIEAGAPLKPDLSNFAALRVSPLEDSADVRDPALEAQADKLRGLISEITTAHEMAQGTINGACADYHASAPDFDILPDTNGGLHAST